MQQNAIEFIDVSKIFSGVVPVQALDSINFSLPIGCFAAVVGVSGSGKTTLLNLASGLDKPTRGRVIIAEQDITQFSERQLSLFRRSSLGFVFQAYNLFQTLTVVENVEYTMVISGMNKKEARRLAIESLCLVDLEDKAKFFPQKLSGGQQQRVAVARAIASNPKMIFADEPTANLDFETAQRLIDLFQILNRSKGISFLFSTHDRELIKSVNLVLNLKSGVLINK